MAFSVSVTTARETKSADILLRWKFVDDDKLALLRESQSSLRRPEEGHGVHGKFDLFGMITTEVTEIQPSSDWSSRRPLRKATELMELTGKPTRFGMDTSRVTAATGNFTQDRVGYRVRSWSSRSSRKIQQSSGLSSQRPPGKATEPTGSSGSDWLPLRPRSSREIRPGSG